MHKNQSLKKKLGLQAFFDGEKLVGNDFDVKSITPVGIDDMRESLLNKTLYCPELFYTIYEDCDYQKLLKNIDINMSIYVLNCGVAGIEFLKTLSYQNQSYPKIFEILQGNGIIIFTDSKEDIFLLRVKSGDKIIIPANAYSVVCNIKFSPLILAEFSYKKQKSKKTLEDMQGMPYYVISKNSKPAIVRNPVYKNVKKVKKIKWMEITKKHNISPKTPIFKQLLRKYEKMDWLFKKNYSYTDTDS